MHIGIKSSWFFSIVMLSFFLSASSCGIPARPEQLEENGQQKKLVAHFYARHLALEGVSRGEATFKIEMGDSTSPECFLAGGVRFQQGVMEERNMESINRKRYQANRTSTFQDTFSFSFFWPEGERQAFAMSLAGIEDFQFSSPYQRGSEAKVEWTAPPLSKEEMMVLLLTDAAQKVATLEIKGPTQSSQIIIPADKLKDIAPGKATAELVRRKRFSGKGINWESTGEAEFYSIQKEIIIR